jgi:tRNA A-37 threonylcarbamoyl transferase component Bud32
MPDGIDAKPGAAADPLVGRTLSQRYRILAKLGEGAMAAVYLAEHTGVGTNIVLKVLLPDLARRPEIVDRFLNEVKIASGIHHDNIIDIFYSGRSPEGLVFLAMEYVPGVTLQALLHQHGALGWDRAQPILHQVADALTAAHAQGVIHRDVKPDNVLIREAAEGGGGDVVKVVDFGISNVVGDLSESKGIYGTPEYMSPEQAQALPPDPRDDVYAFGCLMYNVVTGQLPFRAPTLQQLLIQQIQAPPEPPRQRRPDLAIPEEVESLILRAMQKRRADRWPTMSQLADALGAMRTARPAPAPITASRLPPVTPPAAPEPEPPPPPPRRPVVLRAALAGAVVALIVTAALLYHGPRAAPGQLEIVSVPPDAAIFIGEKKLGEHSPLMVQASPGRYTLRVVRDGYDPVYHPFEIRSREALRIPVNLRVSEATRLEVTSDPPGARLLLDGAPITTSGGDARTPHTITRVTPGRHVIEMDDVAEHSPWRSEIEVVLGAHRKIHGALSLAPGAGGAADVAPPPPPADDPAPKGGARSRTSPRPPAKAGDRPPNRPAASSEKAAPGTAPAPPVARDAKGILYLDINRKPQDKAAPDSGAR